jgi:hypothetical protein
MKKPPVRVPPFAFPLRTAVATRGPHLRATLGSAGTRVNPRAPLPVDNTVDEGVDDADRPWIAVGNG